MMDSVAAETRVHVRNKNIIHSQDSMQSLLKLCMQPCIHDLSLHAATRMLSWPMALQKIGKAQMHGSNTLELIHKRTVVWLPCVWMHSTSSR
eukprot:scaffold125389_cov20-Tisochrysis_lutea.AAC.2